MCADFRVSTRVLKPCKGKFLPLQASGQLVAVCAAYDTRMYYLGRVRGRGMSEKPRADGGRICGSGHGAVAQSGVAV